MIIEIKMCLSNTLFQYDQHILLQKWSFLKKDLWKIEVEIVYSDAIEYPQISFFSASKPEIDDDSVPGLLAFSMWPTLLRNETLSFILLKGIYYLCILFSHSLLFTII